MRVDIHENIPHLFSCKMFSPPPPPPKQQNVPKCQPMLCYSAIRGWMGVRGRLQEQSRVKMDLDFGGLF